MTTIQNDLTGDVDRDFDAVTDNGQNLDGNLRPDYVAEVATAVEEGDETAISILGAAERLADDAPDGYDVDNATAFADAVENKLDSDGEPDLSDSDIVDDDNTDAMPESLAELLGLADDDDC